MKRRRNRNKIRYHSRLIMFILACVISTMAVGYSIIAINLKINGTAKIKTNWNIMITNVSGISFESAVNKKGNIVDKLKADFNATITEKNGKATYDITVTNYGELTAVLKEIKGIDEANTGNLVYTLVGIEIGDEYPGNSIHNFQVEVTAKDGTEIFPLDGEELHLELVFEKSETGDGDMTPPEMSPEITDIKTNAITVKSNCRDDESGLKFQKYRINNGEWITGTEQYTFTGLKTGEYQIQVECTNGEDLVNTSNTLTTNTKAMPMPKVVINPSEDVWASVKTATITYSNEQSDFVKEYSLNDGKSWEKLTSETTKMINFTEDGSIKVKLSDGVNEIVTDTHQITKVDSKAPTTPTISGGGSEWTKDSRTIKVTTESTSLSGIKNYKYCITSSASLTGKENWIDLGANIKEVTISTQGQNYVYFKAVNNVGTESEVSNSQVVKIDKTAPTDVSVQTKNITSNSIEVTATGEDLESGISKYEFSNNNGNTWIDNGKSNTYNFTGLTTGDYNIKVRVTNNVGLVTTSDAFNIPTSEILTPTYRINTTNWATEKTVTVTYPERQLNFIYEYSIDGGDKWITVESGTTAEVKFTNNGTIIARVRDGVNTVTAASFTVDKIDSSTPTAPTITGGSTSWTSTTRTISVSKDSISPSGIKNYEYYISTSNSSQTGGTWTSLDSGVKSVVINKPGTYYIYFRAVNNVGTKGTVSAAQTTKIDTTPSSASLSVTGKTTKSVSLSATCTDNESGISKYEFSKDNGSSWTANGTTKTYTFTNLTTGTYNFKVRCTNGSGLVTTSSAVSGATNEITAPTYSIDTEDWATEKTVTVTYPARQTDFIYEYSINGGSSWETVSSGTTVDVKFTSNGTIIARVRDGVNTKTAATYTVNKIDTDAPTAPTISGGSTSWSSTAKTISVTKDSTSTSGIKNYEYYISTSSSSQTGGSWISLGAGVKQVSISTNGTRYIYFRAVNNAGTAGAVSAYQTTKIDTGTPTAPTITGGSTSWSSTAKTISVSSASTSTSGIKNYQYYISTSSSSQTGGLWIDLGTGVTSVSITTNGTKYIYFRAVNNAGTIGNISAAQTTKIDTSTPTAPTLTGGSTTWINGTRTISVSAGSTSPSGIKNYQYYISTSASSQTGGTWTDLNAGIKQVTISTNGTRYIYFRAVNNVGTIGTVSSSQTTRIDTTAPTGVSVGKGTVTSKSIQVTANGTDSESGITKYEFSKDNGSSWVSNGTTKTYIFTNLTTGSYNIKVRVTNGSGLVTTSNVLAVATVELEEPTYSVNTTGWATSKTVTITYPERQTGYIYEYSTNGGSSWETVESGTTAEVKFTANGTIIARVRDGVNTKTASTYTVNNIDTGKPTAPIITGGSTSWSSTAKTISVSTDSTSTSGIKNYQYYISTSATTQTGGSWTSLGAGVKQVSINTNGTHYIYFRAVNNAGTAGSISSPQTTKIDTGTPTAPTITGGSTSWINGKRTISVNGASTSTSGIKNYEYYISTSSSSQTGGSWISLGTGVTSVDITTNGTRYIYFRAVNNAGKIGAVSAYQTTKIDTSTPTAPTLTGGSTTWINGTRTISVSTESSSPSGIKNYQYYISTSASSQAGGTWTDLTAGTKQVTISTNGTRYIYFRAVNNVGTLGTVSAAQTTKIDTTASSASLAVTGKTTKSVNLSATCTDNESGITKYEFSKDNGSNWTANGTTKTYTFTNLTTGTYNFKVRCTNGSGLVTTSSAVSGATNEITAPTYSINTTGWATSKTVTVTYPARQTDFIYEYSTNGGSNWTTVSSGTTVDVKFTSNGTIIARVRDGVNTKTAATYTVDKIDTGTPTAPTITGGSTSWSATAKTISVSTDSTSTSGIKNYQYYISTSASTQTGGSWTNLGSGVKQVSISTNGTHYIYFRAVNNAGTVGSISSPQTTKIDTGTPTAPTITGGSTSWSATAKTISVSSASTSTSGIKNYQYYISTSSTTQTGGTWTSLGSGVTSVDITTNGTRYIYFRAVNNAGTAGTVSAAQTTKIDTSTPTAPTITGGSTTWINGNRTISVSSASTSPSGIKNYQYYISTSSSSQTGGTWTDLASGTTSVTISTNGIRYIYFRAVNNAGTIGSISAAQTTKIDKTAPTSVSVGKGTVTSKSIQVTANGTDSESGIAKYEFSKDNGSSWINGGTTNTYTFSNLTTGTYNIKVRVTNGSGMTTTSSVLAIATNTLTAPTYSINTTDWSTEKTVTITYPTRQTGFIYEYSTNGGNNWITVSSGTTASVKFTSNGTIIARVSDGVNIKTASSYTVNQIDNIPPSCTYNDNMPPMNVSGCVNCATYNWTQIIFNDTGGSGLKNAGWSSKKLKSWSSPGIQNDDYKVDNYSWDFMYSLLNAKDIIVSDYAGNSASCEFAS